MISCRKCNRDLKFIRSYKAASYEVKRREGGKDIPTGEVIGSGAIYWYQCYCGYSLKASATEL